LPECDVEYPAEVAPGEGAAILLQGYLPSSETFRLANYWPLGVSPGPLFPEEFSTYKTYDGVEYDVQCFVPGAEVVIEKVECPGDFVNPQDENHVKSCIKPCPVNAYTDDEYTIMWLLYVIVGMIGFVLNAFMVLTWTMAGKKVAKAVPLQLKCCTGIGLLFGVVETIPVMVLHYDLPCTCETEECIGSSAMCAVNRSGAYLLLGILINLSTLTYSLYSAISGGNSSTRKEARKKNLYRIANFIPLVLMIIAYIFDSDDYANDDNGVLNLARHAFNCSMRFPNMLVEWLLLWIHFVWSATLIIGFTLVSWWKIVGMQRKMNSTSSSSDKRMASSRRRLLKIAMLTSCCLLLNMMATIILSSTLDEWSRSTDLNLSCELFETKFTRKFENYGFDEAEERAVCSLETMKTVETEADTDCTHSCLWEPAFETGFLICSTVDNDFDELINDPVMFENLWSCDCPCSSYVQVEKPSVAFMTLSYLAQSLVVTIVGINMSFTEDNLKVWKGIIRKKQMFGLKPSQTAPDSGTVVGSSVSNSP